MHRGTIKNLEGKLAINGVTLTQPELSMLTRIGRGVFCNPVGTIKTSAGKGKPATIWEFNLSTNLAIEAVTVQATDAPEVSANSVATVETIVADAATETQDDDNVAQDDAIANDAEEPTVAFTEPETVEEADAMEL